MAFTSTLTLLWRHMSRPLFCHASPHSDRSAACCILYLNMPCWHLSVLLLSARSTTAATCWPVSPVISWADYSLSWMLLLVWSSMPEDQSTSLRCCTIFTGCIHPMWPCSSFRRSTFGNRAFPVAPPRTWNHLPSSDGPRRPYRRFVKNWRHSFSTLVTMDIIINLFHPCAFLWPSTHILLTM